jgi:predicted aspartyl protease
MTPTPAASPTGGVVPLPSGAPIMVEAVLNGVPLRLLLDTGADRTVISPSALSRAGIDARTGTPFRISGVTGSSPASLVNVPRLDIAGAQVGPLGVVAFAVPGEVDGLLGRDVLDAFTVTFDPAQNRATLTPRPQ